MVTAVSSVSGARCTRFWPALALISLATLPSTETVPQKV